MAANEAAKARLAIVALWATALKETHTDEQAEKLRKDILACAGGYRYARGHVGYADGSVLRVAIAKNLSWDEDAASKYVHIHTYGCR